MVTPHTSSLLSDVPPSPKSTLLSQCSVWPTVVRGQPGGHRGQLAVPHWFVSQPHTPVCITDTNSTITNSLALYSDL